MKYKLTKMQTELEKYLDVRRFEHTIGVRYTCAALAMCYGYDITKAEVAGLLHDCAKCIPATEKLRLCAVNNIEITDSERENPFLLHSKLGAWIAKEKYGVDDEEILDAIRYHTTGRAEMTLLEKITYIADYIEPLRNKVTNLNEIRALAFQDIDKAMCVILENTLMYLKNADRNIDSTTEVAYNYYKNVCI